MTVRLEHSGPVELGVLSSSLQALASYHGRFAQREGATISEDHVKLYVRDIRTGSIIVELVALAKTVGPLLGGVTTVVSFARTMRSLFDYGTGKAPTPPPGTTARDARELSTFVQPVAMDARAVLHIQAGDGSPVTVQQNFYLDSNEANATQNRLGNFAARQGEPLTGTHRQRLFYFHQATSDAAGKTGDRGVIESLSPKVVKTVFASEEIKRQMLDEALFTKVYIVDVAVESVHGEPRLYRILAVLESMDR